MSILLKQWATGIAGGQSWSSYWKTLNDHFDEDLVVPYNAGDYAVSATEGKYEAWPQIAADTSGNLYVVYRTCDSNTHLYDASGRVVMRISEDEGETWGAEITVADEADIDDRNCAILIFDDDGTETILVTYNTYTAASATEFVCRKATVADPTTWSAKIVISDGVDGYGRGQPRLLSNGTILAPFNITNPSNACLLGKSTDGGDTWTNITAAAGYRQEFAIVEAKTAGAFTGKVYGMIRNSESPYGYYELVSTDYGETWTAKSLMSEITCEKSTPVEFLRYDDNTVLAFITDYTGGPVFKSTDECESWTLIGYWGGLNTNPANPPSYYPSPIKLTDGIGVVWCINSTTSNVLFNKMEYPALKAPAGCKWGANRDGAYTVEDSKLKITGTWLQLRSFTSFELPCQIEIVAKHKYCNYFGLAKESDKTKSGIYDASNNIGIDSRYDRTVAEKTNDSFYGTAPTEEQWKTYIIEYRADSVKIYEDGVLLLEKTPGDGSGIPAISPSIICIYNYEATGYIEVDSIGVRSL